METINILNFLLSHEGVFFNFSRVQQFYTKEGVHKIFSLSKISISIIFWIHDTKIYQFSRVQQFYTKEGVHKVYQYTWSNIQ